MCVKPFPAKALPLVDNRGTFSISSKVKIFFYLGLLHIDFSPRLRTLRRVPPYYTNPSLFDRLSIPTIIFPTLIFLLEAYFLTPGLTSFHLLSFCIGSRVPHLPGEHGVGNGNGVLICFLFCVYLDMICLPRTFPMVCSLTNPSSIYSVLSWGEI